MVEGLGGEALTPRVLVSSSPIVESGIQTRGNIQHQTIAPLTPARAPAPWVRRADSFASRVRQPSASSSSASQGRGFAEGTPTPHLHSFKIVRGPTPKRKRPREHRG